MGAILFDFGGTLDSDGVPWPRRFFSLYEEAGLKVEWETFLKAFYRSDDNLAQRHALQGLDLERTVQLQVDDVLETLAPGRADLAKSAAAAFTNQSRRHFECHRPLLEKLRARFRLGIVSNFYGNLEGLMAAEGWGGLFDVVADSGMLSITKPDPAIFLHALQRLETAPADAFMVGDSLPCDIRGAEALGMAHAWLVSGPQDACCPTGRSIRTLSELESVLPTGVPA